MKLFKHTPIKASVENTVMDLYIGYEGDIDSPEGKTELEQFQNIVHGVPFEAYGWLTRDYSIERGYYWDFNQYESYFDESELNDAADGFVVLSVDRPFYDVEEALKEISAEELIDYTGYNAELEDAQDDPDIDDPIQYVLDLIDHEAERNPEIMPMTSEEGKLNRVYYVGSAEDTINILDSAIDHWMDEGNVDKFVKTLPENEDVEVKITGTFSVNMHIEELEEVRSGYHVYTIDILPVYGKDAYRHIDTADIEIIDEAFK